jgi:hypothetical protein
MLSLLFSKEAVHEALRRGGDNARVPSELYYLQMSAVDKFVDLGTTEFELALGFFDGVEQNAIHGLKLHWFVIFHFDSSLFGSVRRC